MSCGGCVLLVAPLSGGGPFHHLRRGAGVEDALVFMRSAGLCDRKVVLRRQRLT